MPPSILTEPEATIQFKQGFQEGYKSGKACLKQELKELLAKLSEKEAYGTSSATFSNLDL